MSEYEFEYRSRNDDGWIRVLFYLGILCVALLAGYQCTASRAPESKAVIEAYGYTEVELTGYTVFGCSDDDTIHQGFIATNPQGRAVAGTLCCGAFLKQCTLRLEPVKVVKPEPERSATARH